ncbi:MAG: thiol:disulfide interchange protein DsbA/DsbL [Thiobacillaceae bacterium]
MTLDRRAFNRFLAAGLASLALPATAAPLLEGRDYERIQPPQPGDSPGKIEVLEFFSYGCPHCRDFHPLVMSWAAGLPGDVAFRRVPVSFGRAAWANLARLYYSLEALDQLGRLDDAVFRAIHDARANLYSERAILDWVAGQGVDRQRFADTLASFGVGTRLARDEQRVKTYKVQGVPLITVAGRYAVTGRAARQLADLLPIADGLITLARGEHRARR